MNEEEKEAVEYLNNYKYDNEVREAIDIILNLIEKLQKENEELKTKLKIRNGDIEYLQNKINNHFISDVEIRENYIPIQKIKDKIEEIKMTSSQINGDYFMNNYKIEVLQELLKEEK